VHLQSEATVRREVLGLDSETYSQASDGTITDYTSVDVFANPAGANGFGGACRFCNHSLSARQDMSMGPGWRGKPANNGMPPQPTKLQETLN
jgi:hypothetical protein